MDHRREPLVVTALVAGMLGLGSAHPDAMRDTRPTVSVVSFTGVEPATGDAMADELAAQLVETGRYRVMARDWLSASPAVVPQSLAALRDAAAAAGVEYLVQGHGQQGMSLGTRRADLLFIEVRVFAVATGDVIRTATGRTQMPARTRRPGPIAPMARPPMTRPPIIGPPLGPPMTQSVPTSGSPLNKLLAAVAAVRQARQARQAHQAASAPNVTASPRWEQALADIAKALVLPGASR